MRPLRVLFVVLVSLVVVLVGPARADDVTRDDAEPERIGRVVADECRNLALVIELDAGQQRRAGRLLPPGLVLTDQPTLLVESSTCRTARVNGRRIGRFHLSEAALSIQAPRPVYSAQLPETSAENIFMLSQLDTNRRLSAFKERVGYPSEVTEISIDLGDPRLPRTATARAGGRIAPSSVTATLTPQLTPDGVFVPNPGVVYKLWTVDERGRLVVTTNSNLRLGHAAVGYGTVRVPRGTLLHRLLGAATATGSVISGAATRFVNDTYRFPTAGR